MQAVMSEFFKLKYKLEDQITNWTQLNNYPTINVKRNYYKNSLNISIKDFNADIWILNISTQDLNNVLSIVSLDSHISYHVLSTDFINNDHWILVDSLQSGKYLSINLLYFYICSYRFKSILFRKNNVCLYIIESFYYSVHKSIKMK